MGGPDGGTGNSLALSSVAALTSYEIRNLVAHLEAAGREESVHRLLTLEESGSVNVWLETKDVRGDLAGYVSDVQRALRLVRRTADEGFLTGAPMREVGTEIRYVLLTASVRAQAETLPVRLLVALVEKEVWSPESALAYLEQIQSYASRTRALAALAPHVPPALLTGHLRAALAAAGHADEEHRSDAVSSLAPYLPSELIGEALAVAAGIEFSAYRSSALIALAPKLTSEHMPLALRAARSIEGEYRAGGDKATALCALGPMFPPELRTEALAAARAIDAAPWRAVALTGLGEPLSSDAVFAALAASSSGEDDWDRAESIIRVAPLLSPRLLGAALAAARTLHQHKPRALAALAPLLPADLHGDVLNSIRELKWDREVVLVAIAPRVTGKLLKRALRLAAGIDREAGRVEALTQLALQLPEGERDAVLRESFSSAEQIPFGAGGADVVVSLVAHLPDDLLPAAVDLARSVGPSLGGVDIMTAAAVRFPKSERRRLLREALHASRRIDDEWGERARAVGRIASSLPEEVLSDLTNEVRDEESDFGFRERLAEIAEFLRPEDLRAAVRSARELRDVRQQSLAVAALVPYLGESTTSAVLSEALTAVRGIQTLWDRAMALGALAPVLPTEHFADALAIAEEIKYEPGARAIAEVAPYVPAQLLRQAVGAARATQYEHWKADALAALAAKASEPERSTLFIEALEAVGKIDYDEHPGFKTDVLVRFARELPEPLLHDALALARRLRDYEMRARSLASLASHLSANEGASVLQEALSEARKIHMEETRAETLVDLGGDIPGVSEAIQEIDDPRWRTLAQARIGQDVPDAFSQQAIERLSDADCEVDDVELAIALLPFASTSFGEAALPAVARLLERAGSRSDEGGSFDLFAEERVSRAVAKIAQYLDAGVLPHVLDLVGRISPEQRAPAIGALVQRFRSLPRRRLEAFWDQARAALDTGPRHQVLEAIAPLAPAIDLFGAEAGVAETAKAVHVVARWQP